jgi:hypothetical protein
MKNRLISALAAYAVLAGLAYMLVQERRMRAAVLLLFGALAAKTLIAAKAQAIRESEEQVPDRDTDPEIDVPERNDLPPIKMRYLP